MAQDFLRSPGSTPLTLTAMALPMEKTTGGMTKAKLSKNKRGKIVSKAASVRAKRNFADSALKKWCDATKAARKALNLKGFVPVGGKTSQGKALYAKAKSLLK